MQFVYKPEGADPLRWEFDPNRLMSPEVEVIERHTGLTFGEWADAVGRGSFTAIHGLLYVLLKRKHPTLKWDEVAFCMADIDFEMSVEEQRAAVAELEAKAASGSPLTEAEADVLTEMRAALAESGEEPGPKDED
jgi:hypothetical protein